MLRPTIVCLLLSAVAAGCTPRNGDHDELAGELRALRKQLAHTPRTDAGAQATAVGKALEPLRGALQQLGDAQRDLATRQLLLTQELQRWTRLVVDGAAEQRAAEGQSLTVRLQELENQLAAQETRHREVEQLLQRALDETADRLERFLEQLPAIDAAEPVPAAPASEKPASQEPASVEKGAAGAWFAFDAAPWSPLPWVLITLFGGFVLWRAVRPRAGTSGMHPVIPTASATALPAEPPLAEAFVVPAPTPEPSAPSDAQQLWAAAALLGEAVDRLRQNTAQPPSGAVVATEPVEPAVGPDASAADADEWSDPESSRDAEQDVDLDEVFVLDDELGDRAAEPTDEPSTREPAAAQSLRRLPHPSHPRVVFRLPVRDGVRARADILQFLGSDPRVLRRPGPELSSLGDEVQVSFVLLPGLPPAERSLLEQRLRETVA